MFCVPIDSLEIPGLVALVKIDGERHDFQVLKEMVELLRRNHSVLVVEGDASAIRQWPEPLDESSETIPSSPNTIFRPASSKE